MPEVARDLRSESPAQKAGQAIPHGKIQGQTDSRYHSLGL